MVDDILGIIGLTSCYRKMLSALTYTDDLVNKNS